MFIKSLRVLEKEESINLIIDKTKDTDFKKIKQKSGDRKNPGTGY